MNTKSLKTLEYNKIIAQLETYASSPLGRDLCRNLVPSIDVHEIRQMQKETSDALTRVRQKGSISFTGLKDVGGSLKRLEIGSSLNITELLAISSMLTGATTLLQYFADEVALSSLVFWTFGDLGSTSWQSLRGMALAVLLLIGYCYLHRWDYNALLSGEETALSLGINVQRLTLTNVVLTCLVCSIIVSNVGLINFIGLVAPHIVRMVVGNNYIYLIPGSVLAGAALLLLSDLVARVVIMPVILPIGALTAFLGGRCFCICCSRGGVRHDPGRPPLLSLQGRTPDPARREL